LGLRGNKWQEAGEDFIMRGFITCNTSPNFIRMIKSRRMRWPGRVARMGEMRTAYEILVGKLERKRPLGKHRFRREDNIRMDLRQTGWETVDWIHLTQDRDW